MVVRGTPQREGTSHAAGRRAHRGGMRALEEARVPALSGGPIPQFEE
jgi:hypothetical protein